MINTEGFFGDIFRNAHENSVIIMDDGGHILDVNKGFRDAFAYKLKDIKGKHFRILFTEKDQQLKKPEREIKETLLYGAKSDNNYLVHKDGSPVWVMGESVSVTNKLKEKYIVKIIQNIHAQKQLEQFLLETNEFIDTIFDSLKEISLIILDSELRVLKTNKTFDKMFGLKKAPLPESRLYQIENSFWKGTEIKKSLVDIIVNHRSLRDAIFNLKSGQGTEKKISINSKLFDGDGKSKRILLVIKNER